MIAIRQTADKRKIPKLCTFLHLYHNISRMEIRSVPPSDRYAVLPEFDHVIVYPQFQGFSFFPDLDSGGRKTDIF